MSYYRNPAMLREWQRILGAYPGEVRARTLFIVCDDASPSEPAAEAALEPAGYELQIYRALEDVPWGQLRMRNLGMDVAPAGSWVLATDIDHVLPPECAARLLDLEPMQGAYYRFPRRMPDGSGTNAHANSFLIDREWFWREVGGCDERFVGYYGSDSVFRARAALCGEEFWLPPEAIWLVVYNRDGVDVGGIEGAATRDWGRKGSPWHAKAHPAVRREMSVAHLKKPQRALAFEWVRVR